MTTKDVAEKLVDMCRKGQFIEAIDALYHQDIESIEPKEAPAPNVKGLKAVRQKEIMFRDSVSEVHSMEISDPVVSQNHFSCAMKMDATFKEHGRMVMDEICVYQVKDGKIIREEFFFTIG